MAKTLDDKKSLMFLGGGKSGKEPLIFQTNGSPYRGFLDGRINKKQYQLILRLSNMELKKLWAILIKKEAEGNDKIWNKE